MEKPTLVLIPGWAGNQTLWEHQAHALKDIVQTQVIVMDKETTRDAMVERVLKEAPRQFALAGQSMGGWVAEKVAATAQDRVTKLILANSWASPDPKLNKTQAQVIQAIRAGQLEQTVATQLHMILYSDRLNDLPFLEKLKKMMLSLSPELLCSQMQAMLDDYVSLPLLSQIKAPTLIIHGRQDHLFLLEEQQNLTKKIPNARLAIIEECGHVSPMEQPQAVTALIRLFLGDSFA